LKYCDNAIIGALPSRAAAESDHRNFRAVWRRPVGRQNWNIPRSALQHRVTVRLHASLAYRPPAPFDAMMGMKKIDIAAIKAARRG